MSSTAPGAASSSHGIIMLYVLFVCIVVMSSAASFTDDEGNIWTITIPDVDERGGYMYTGLSPPQPLSYGGARSSHGIRLGESTCTSVAVDDLFRKKEHDFTQIGAASEHDIIQYILQSVVDSVGNSEQANYDDATLAIVEQLERLLRSADQDSNRHPEYVRTLARQAAESFWDYAYEPMTPPGVRRESAVELVGMGVITLATALGALVLRYRRRSQNGKMPKSVKVAVMRKIQLAPPSSRIRPVEHARPVNEDEPEAERPKPASSPKACNTAAAAARQGRQDLGNADRSPSQQRPPRERIGRAARIKVKRPVLVGISDEPPPARKITIQSAIAASQAIQLRPVVEAPLASTKAARDSTPKNRPRSRPVHKSPVRIEPPAAAANRLVKQEPRDSFVIDEGIEDDFADLSDPETSRPVPAEEEASVSDEENSDITYWEAVGEGNRDDWHYDDHRNLTVEALIDDEIDRLLELKRAEELQASAGRVVPPPQDIGGFMSVLDMGLATSTTRFHTDITPRSDRQRILRGATKIVGGMAFSRELPVPPCVISYIRHHPSHLESHFRLLELANYHHAPSHHHHYHSRSPVAEDRHKNTDRASALHRNSNEAHKSTLSSAAAGDSREKAFKKASTVSRSRGELCKRNGKRATRFRLLLPPPGLGHNQILKS
ncbi:hypothetical protein FOL47_006933 [Perkinsus chesapeaki]|uniref:Transmembrane protein n=1 Tax=Perkinsus chesapeaki TaxID=330153 RepID=A0A7J6LNG9_PERCH|nr:hypothetical protein FOL47_006933 [Perkinsus chesapeaki]